MKKTKIIFGISLILVAILFITAAIYLFSILPDDAPYTLKEGLVFFGAFMISFLSIMELIGGVIMITDALDLF